MTLLEKAEKATLILKIDYLLNQDSSIDMHWNDLPRILIQIIAQWSQTLKKVVSSKFHRFHPDCKDKEEQVFLSAKKELNQNTSQELELDFL